MVLLFIFQDEFCTQNGRNTIVRDNALYQAREFRGRSVHTPRCLILDVGGSLGSMSKEGYFSYASASDLESLNEQASSTWGGGVSVSRFDAVRKVPFQRTLDEGMNLWANSSRSSASNRSPVLELLEAKKQLIQSKQRELEAMRGELLASAKAGNAAPGFLFDLQRKVTDTEAEVEALEEDIVRRTHLYRVSIGEEDDTEGIFDLTDSKYWTDYNKTFWHPSCLNILPSLTLDSPVDIWDPESMTREDMEQYTDRLRTAFEDCDQLEGLQVFVDSDTVFGALAGKILDEVKDELGKVRNISFPIFSIGGPSIGQTAVDTRRIRGINRTMTLASLHQSSAMVMPLDPSVWRSKTSFPHLENLHLQNMYQIGALLASIVDSVSLPYRSTSQGYSWRQFTDSLVVNNANFALVSAALPLGLSENNTLSQQFFGYDIYGNPESRKITQLDKKILPHASWMTPMLAFTSDPNAADMNAMESTVSGVALPWSESVVLRGVSPEFAFNPADPSYHAPSVLYQYLKRYPCASRSFVAQESGSAVPISYPRFFDKNLGIKQSMAMMTHVQVTRRLADFFEHTAKFADYEIANRYPTLNFDRDSVLATQDALLTLQEDYSS